MIYIDLGQEDMVRKPVCVSRAEKLPFFAIGKADMIPVGYSRGKTVHVGLFHLNKHGVKKLLDAIPSHSMNEFYTDQIPQLVIRFTWPNDEGRTQQRFVVGAEILNDGIGFTPDKIVEMDVQYIAREQSRDWEII